MRCENAQPWLGTWQDGEVSRWRHWQIARHLQKCALCQAEVAALAQLEKRLKIADPVTNYHQPITVPAPFRLGGLRYGVLAATLVLVAVTGLYTFRDQGSNNPKSARRPGVAPPLAVQPQTTRDLTPSVMPAVKLKSPRQSSSTARGFIVSRRASAGGINRRGEEPR